MDGIIVISDLVKKYGGKTAVDHLNLEVRRGELFGFLGPNGAGKTTTVRCVSTLTGYDSGSVTVDGFDIEKNPIEAKNRMGVIQQQVALDKDLTVKENMISRAMYRMMTKKERNARIKELSDYFGLNEYLEMPVDSLSGGWKKRVAIVCAVLHEPKVLFLDEPTSGLDINARRLLWDVVRSLNRKGTTIFLTTHYIEEAEALCDRVGIIDRGKVIALDEPKKLCDAMGSTAVEYMEGGKTQYRYFQSRGDAKVFVSSLESEDDVLIRNINLEDVFVELTGRSVGVPK